MNTVCKHCLRELPVNIDRACAECQEEADKYVKEVLKWSPAYWRSFEKDGVKYIPGKK